jgi:putative Holliday junction resolvase
VIVGSVDDGRAYLVINLDEALVDKGLDASQLVREIGRHIGGGGGGRPTLAEAGGKNPAGLRDALGGGQAGDRGRAEVKVLALDYGRARTGVAVSDPTGTIARPVGMVERAGTEKGLAKLVELIRRHDADQVVVGLPLTLQGTRGEQAQETEVFIEALAAAAGVPVVSFDERFTTNLAENMADATADEDARAAAHLLTSYLAWASARA